MSIPGNQFGWDGIFETYIMQYIIPILLEGWVKYLVGLLLFHVTQLEWDDRAKT